MLGFEILHVSSGLCCLVDSETAFLECCEDSASERSFTVSSQRGVNHMGKGVLDMGLLAPDPAHCIFRSMETIT